MEPIPVGLLVCLVASIAANVFQLYLAKTNKKKPAPDLTAKELLGDLMRGGAVVRIEVIDPTQIFLRSPNA